VTYKTLQNAGAAVRSTELVRRGYGDLSHNEYQIKRSDPQKKTEATI
jgi:hypothetical protein